MFSRAASGMALSFRCSLADLPEPGDFLGLVFGLGSATALRRAVDEAKPLDLLWSRVGGTVSTSVFILLWGTV